MSAWLLDTGPLVAALNRRDPSHAACAEAIAGFSGSLLTTGAVVTESMHLLGHQADGPKALADFLDEAQVDIRDCFSPTKLRTATELMTKYADTPMDFADATLVQLGEETGQSAILTLDRRGFRTYRMRGNRRFTLVLD